MRRSRCNARASNGGSVHLRSDIKGRELPPDNILIPLERQLMRYNFAADSFYIVKLCSRLFVLYCRNCMKDDKFRYLIPILRKLGAAPSGRSACYGILAVLSDITRRTLRVLHGVNTDKAYCFIIFIQHTLHGHLDDFAPSLLRIHIHISES